MNKWYNALDQQPPTGKLVLTKLEDGKEVPSRLLKNNTWEGPYSPLFWRFIESDLQHSDSVNHPKHYNSDPSGIECIEIVRHRNFNVGNAIKYLWRAGLKDDPSMDIRKKTIEDLEKASFYIEDEINRLKGAGDE